MDTDTIFSILGVFAVIAAAIVIIPFGAWFLIFRAAKKAQPPAPELYATPRQAVVTRSGVCSARLYPNAKEVFFPPPPHDKPVYEITFSGTVRRTDGERLADAFYATDHNGNFTHDAHWLSMNNYRLSGFEMITSDRCEHRYTIRVDGWSGRLTLALADRLSCESYDRNPGWTGTIDVAVELLPATMPRVADVRRREKERCEADRKSREVAEQFSEVIQALCLRAELYRNWEDQAFREQFARAYGTELMKCQSDIRKEANHVLEQHHVVAYLRRHYPKVVERLLGKFEALLIAERIALEPKEKPKPVPPPRPRLTIDEVRERICRRIEVQGGDRRAAVATILTQKQEQIEMLDQFSLTEDEREQQVREIEDWAAGQLMKLNEGKEASNAGYQTIS